jgi:4-amino-4-deoxy-L-arabinose transferase-like glycosyltransferase
MLFYIFSPLTIIYGQAFLLEMTALCFGLLAYDLFFRWHQEGKQGSLFLSGIFFSLMLATRIYFLPAILPPAILLIRRSGWRSFLTPSYWLFLFLIVALPAGWQFYGAYVAAAHGDQSSLLDNLRVFIFRDTTLKKQAVHLNYFLPALNTAVNKLATPVGFVLAVLGLFSREERLREVRHFAFLFLVCFIPLFFVTSRKFVEFEYYFLPLVPIAVLLAVLALSQLSAKGRFRGFAQCVLAALVILLSLRFSISPVLRSSSEDRYVLETAKALRGIADPNDRVIASHGSSTSLLYYTDRDGWAFYAKEGVGGVRNLMDKEGTAIERLERFRGQGAKYFVLANKKQVELNPAFFDYLREQYPAVYETSNSVIFSLEKTA